MRRLAALMTIAAAVLLACQVCAARELGKHAVTGYEVGIVGFHDDSRAYSPLIGVGGCLMLRLTDWCAVLGDGISGSRTYRVGNEYPVEHRECTATYFDVMPVLSWGLRSSGITYLGAGAVVASATVEHTWYDPVGALTFEYNLGQHVGLCVGGGVILPVSTPIAVHIAFRDRFVTGRHVEMAGMMDWTLVKIVTDVPMGGLALTVGIAMML